MEEVGANDEKGGRGKGREGAAGWDERSGGVEAKGGQMWKASQGRSYRVGLKVAEQTGISLKRNRNIIQEGQTSNRKPINADRYVTRILVSPLQRTPTEWRAGGLAGGWEREKGGRGVLASIGVRVSRWTCIGACLVTQNGDRTM